MFDMDFLKTCASGFRRMTDEAQAVLRDTITSIQTSDGLFPDRSGHGDIYYTLFGLCLAYVSDAGINRDACLQSLKQASPADIVHHVASVRCQGLLKLLSLPKIMRNIPLPLPEIDLSGFPDHAFPQGDRFSPYSCFLLNDTATDLSPYRLESGLYSNMRNASEYGVAATAAALCLRPDARTASALADLQNDDGTFPGGDLLSTAVSLYALHRTGHRAKYSAREFLCGCFLQNGLFAAVPDDPSGDVEYTVYGLLAMGVTE